ncbi:MAG: SpoIIIAH-like family protein [Clostridiales bacterium]|jgi:stage III sporulation protein AH|nr:SpoIIIAH-like family protein [Clostridiales bacterium]
MKFINAKQILLMGLMSLVLIAGYYKWNVQKTTETPAAAVNVSAEETKCCASCDDETVVFSKETEHNFFANSKLEKGKARDESIETLNKIINNSTLTVDARLSAQKQIAEIAKNIEKEAIIEGLVKAKGYSDCTAFIDENNANVIVKADKLDSPKVAQIKDIIASQTGYKPSQIKISICN